MKNKKRKISPRRMPKRAAISAREAEKLLGMSHEEFIRAQKELVEKGFIEVISGDIGSDEVVYKLNFL